MLKLLRSGAQSLLVKIVLFGLLLMAMAGLALMDVTGMVRGGISDTTVAKVGGEKISAQDFERMVSNTLHEKNIPRNVAVAAGIPGQVLTQEINGRLFAKAARDIGLIPDDAAVAKSVRGMLEPFVREGMSEKDALTRLLATTGYAEDRLAAAIRTQMATDALLGLVTSGAHAPRQLVTDAAKYRREQRRADYFLLSAADAGKVETPPPGALEEYYKTVAAQFAEPERRDVEALVISKKTLGLSEKADEAALKAYYEEHKADFTTPETRVIAQAMTDDEEIAKAVYALAKTTKDLEKAVEVAGKGKTKFIKSTALTEAEMPEELSATAFKGEAGAPLPPVKSPLGWDVMYIEKVTPPAAKGFESVRADILKEVSDDKSAEALYEKAGKIDDALAAGRALEDVAAEYNLKPLLLSKIDASGTGHGKENPAAALPATPKVLEHAFRAEKGETASLIETPAGEFVAVAVKEVYPSETRPLAAVRAAVLDSWRQKETASLIDRQAVKIAERLKLGESFEKVAGSFKKTPLATGWLARGADAAKEKLDKALVPALFSLPRVGDATAGAGEEGIFVLRLSDRRVDPAGQTGEDTASLSAMLDHAMGQGILDQYRAALALKYDVTINDKLVQSMFKPHEEEN